MEKLELDPELEKKVDEHVEENNNNDDSNSQHGEVESEDINNNNIDNNNEIENSIDENVQPKQEEEDDDATGNEVSNIEDNVNNIDEVSKAEVGENQYTTEDAEYADDENESDTARNNTENEVQNEIETDEVPTPTHTLNESNAEVLVINSDEVFLSLFSSVNNKKSKVVICRVESVSLVHFYTFTCLLSIFKNKLLHNDSPSVVIHRCALFYVFYYYLI